MSVTLDLFEYEDDSTCQAAYVSSEVYGSDILTGGTPSAISEYTGRPASFACDNDEGTSWSNNNDGFPSWWKYDLGDGNARIAQKLRLKPAWAPGQVRVKDFKLQGSNNDIGWDDIYTGQHGNNINWEDFTFSNSTAYRYYRIYVTSSWDAGAPNWCQIIEIEMFDIILQCYSEDTIVEQGSYSLEVRAKATDSLNQTLTRTVDPTIDLSGLYHKHLYIRASRTGSNIKIGIHDSGGVTTEITPNILVANTWQEVITNISGVADANKNAIDSIIITIVNADSDNIFYLDDMFGMSVVSRERNIVYDSILELSKTRNIVYDSILELSKTRDVVYDLVLELSRERNILYDSVLELSQERNIVYDLFELIQRLEAPTGVWVKQSVPSDTAVKQNRPTGTWIKQNKPS